MKEETALKITKELMEPFEQIKLSYSKQDGWNITIEDNYYYREQTEQLIVIAQKHNLNFSVENNGINLWEKSEEK